MAIYHLEAKVVSRGKGRSAVAASAYLSCSKILNDYDGVLHDYTRKKGLVWQEVFLPEFAPSEWKERGVLWNAVEENEKTKDSRLAREFVAALPMELSEIQWKKLLSDFISDTFVADGMCADVAIHDPDPPGHNPHAHIMLTVRPLDEKGKWQYKTEKEYLCVRNGEEKGFTAAEFKTAQADDWEKQYQYKVGKKKVYMTPSAAEAKGYERVSKYPKSTKYGRQNPVAERWNSEEQLVLWRKVWAEVTNRYLQQYGHGVRIDHRSHAERGLTEQPTIHEGVIARALEKKGVISDRCEINRQIKADNALLRELKAQMKKLVQAVKNTVPSIAEAMERLRSNMMIFKYQLRYIGAGKLNMGKRVKAVKPELERYAGLVQQIKEKSKERKNLLAEKKGTPFYQIPKLHDLTRRITELTEEFEELKTEKEMLLRFLDCAEDTDISAVKKEIAVLEGALQKLPEQEAKYSAELDEALKQYAELKEQAGGMDAAELMDVRLAIREEKE
ncbi:MAG: MobA/MobL family protein, partial [Clostridiales bacterium]|nr:MobA/MobL family protein [Clostridiales bacterium]